MSLTKPIRNKSVSVASKAADPGISRRFIDSIAIIRGFEVHPTVAVAVSGGIDSMALTLLVQEWIQKNGGKLIALTIDHGLRAESAQEAQQVHHWCDQRGIEHHILRIQDSGFRIQQRIQESAREARYGTLTAWCKEQHILHLMTAHHRDDQAETLFFRLSRGSGIDGLACISNVSVMHGIRMVRPLLGFSKLSLEVFLKENGQAWIDDPTNHKLHYTRNRIRHYLHQSADCETLAERAGHLTTQFGKIRNLLENNLASYLTNTMSLFPEGYATIDYENFIKLPPEYGIRAFAAVILTLAGETYPPRTEKLNRLYKDIMAGTLTRRTFAGLLFINQLSKQRLLVCREPNAIAAAQPLAAYKASLWDSRFYVSWSSSIRAESTLFVRALGQSGIRAIKDDGYSHPRLRDKNIPTLALVALPSSGILKH